MSIQWMVALAVCLAALLAGVRTWRDRGRHRIVRIALSVAAAGLLYVLLFPPSIREVFSADELVVLTPGVTAVQVGALDAAATVVALPGADAAPHIERTPDLATALRRHPGSRRLHILGGGLPARDRDAAAVLVTRFDAAPLPRGLVELDAPAQVRAGSIWRVGGRVEGIADGSVELREPGGTMVAQVALDPEGRFALHAQAKVAGEALFELRVREHDGRQVEAVPVPLVARAGQTLRVLLLAGAPDPELKYLRRWAVDAGFRLDSRMALSEGIALAEGEAALDAAAFRQADIVIIDERAWETLGAASRQALTMAVRDGLGLLLRVTGAVPEPVAAQWAELGFTLQPRPAAAAVAIDHALGVPDTGLRLTLQPVAIEAPDAAPLLRADDGSAVALWRAEQRGRVGLWWLADSWRLALGGERAGYATLWSNILESLVRARGATELTMPREARVDRRAVLCRLGPDASVQTPDGGTVALVVEPAGDGHAGCAGYWPATAGWHVLVSDGARWPFHVRAADEAGALALADDARATRALPAVPTAAAGLQDRPVPLPRWPLFVAWLLVMTLSWLAERRAAHGTPA